MDACLYVCMYIQFDTVVSVVCVTWLSILYFLAPSPERTYKQ